MIQRLQSIWLFVAGLLLGAVTGIRVNNIANQANWLTWTLVVIIFCATAVTIFSIFLYKNRRRQTLFCMVATIFILADIVLACTCAPLKALPVALELIAVILVRMAYHAIKKDDELVRSMDRIR